MFGDATHGQKNRHGSALGAVTSSKAVPFYADVKPPRPSCAIAPATSNLTSLCQRYRHPHRIGGSFYAGGRNGYGGGAGSGGDGGGDGGGNSSDSADSADSAAAVQVSATGAETALAQFCTSMRATTGKVAIPPKVVN